MGLTRRTKLPLSQMGYTFKTGSEPPPLKWLLQYPGLAEGQRFGGKGIQSQDLPRTKTLSPAHPLIRG